MTTTCETKFHLAMSVSIPLTVRKGHATNITGFHIFQLPAANVHPRPFPTHPCSRSATDHIPTASCSPCYCGAGSTQRSHANRCLRGLLRQSIVSIEERASRKVVCLPNRDTACRSSSSSSADQRLTPFLPLVIVPRGHAGRQRLGSGQKESHRT